MTNPNASIPVRKKDTSDSTKDFWKNGAGDAQYHRDDDPCEDAPESGYVHYGFDKIHTPEDSEFCPNCDWSGTEVEQYVE